MSKAAKTAARSLSQAKVSTSLQAVENLNSLKRSISVAVVAAALLAGCSATAQPSIGKSSLAEVAARATFPPGREGQLIQYGHDIIVNTPKYAGKYIRSGMSCEACHVNAGRRPHGGSFLGLYAEYPQFNKRAKRFIMLQDRIAECFLYSMNGHPPAYNSKAMIGIAAYIAFLSRGAAIGKGFSGQALLKISPPAAPNIQTGAKLYAAKCSMCHQANGTGIAGQFPPLWGPKSFNDGAGMSTMSKFAAFVKYNMPQNAPNTLSTQEAYDIAAYVLQPSHKRPHFKVTAIVAFPSQPASYF